MALHKDYNLMSEKYKPDFLKSLQDVRIQVERCRHSLEDRHRAIDRYSLHAGVPIKIREVYDVSRNIYLYGWYVYRFNNVAESQAFGALEYCLKERIGDSEIKDYIKEKKQAYKEETGKRLNLNKGLKLYIEYCRDKKLISNHGFSAWHDKSYTDACEKYKYKKLNEMIDNDLEEIELDYSDIQVANDTPVYDHVQHLIDTANKVRNIYAHGTSMLHPNVLHTFEMVSEFINQLYPSGSDG